VSRAAGASVSIRQQNLPLGSERLYQGGVRQIPPVLLALGLLTGFSPGSVSAADVPVVREMPAVVVAPALLRLADSLRRLEEDGLDPRAYAVPADDLATTDPAAWHAGLMRAASLALADLLHGRVQHLAGRADLRRDIAAVPLAPLAEQLIAAAEPAAVIERAALLPADAGPLKAALAAARARVEAGGWPTVPGGAETLEPGATDPVRVPALRARLAVVDPLLMAAPPEDPAVYDPVLVSAVQRFQAEHGLQPDGRVGRQSLAALNRPAEVLVRQLRVALDMRRAAAAVPAERRIEVNVAHQRLQVLERGRVLLDMPVIVGRPDRQTPMMRLRMNAVQFNPPWGVPERNAREDLLPKFRRSARSMAEKGFRVYTVVDGERVEVNPLDVEWRSVSRERFPYVVRQEAGAANALGRIKFIMPNTEDIFMHDTPDRHLFSRPERAFSSGCIRLERPLDLFDVVAEGTAGWDRTRAGGVLESRATTAVALARPLPVRLHYTAAVVEGGEVRVRPDIYGLDEAYARALDAPARRSPPPATEPARVAGVR
jgi:murein L,D-transpeptidase YcbB/YkuD